MVSLEGVPSFILFFVLFCLPPPLNFLVPFPLHRERCVSVCACACVPVHVCVEGGEDGTEEYFWSILFICCPEL